ncbi:hypothetical protein [Nocardia sp. NRRL S-836]|uniref:hypothetical protein n=1 Tax=Nocardia sp. NRRL S-836 TaxID=1519492 RepID=UPI0012F8EAA9|nr:hypothetical protein [Nocardia sp. NRRL S-836]
MSDDPQPGWVEVQLTDATGTVWSLFDKPPIFDADGQLTPDATYPVDVELDCEIVTREADDNGRELVVISTRRPWGVETESGRHRFEVEPGQLAGA